jgi:dinuclear metal center YbgI/SA1388 family protein
MKLDDILVHLRRIAPLNLAAEWDNVGLLLGDPAAAITRVVTCLTITPEVVAEAVQERVGLIITHHPIFFRPVKQITSATIEGRMILTLARQGVAVYSAHTAFDSAPSGINAKIAERLELSNVFPLRAHEVVQCKVVVFTPDKDLVKVSDAMFAAGAGTIGQYNECSFRLAGTGTFFATEATNPTVGRKGRREDVQEWRLEAICPEEGTGAVVSAMRQAHSYEEPAYDVYTLRPVKGGTGDGRMGRLPRPTPLADFARTVKEKLGAGGVQVVGEPARMVEKVAIACGVGGELRADAALAGADVLVAGELSFHGCLAARAEGLAVVLPGHFASERFAMEALAQELQSLLPDVRIWPSQRERDVLQWIG